MRSLKFYTLHFACCIGIYLLTLTHVHTFDALSYILDVDRKPWPELFHPHHLAYGPLGALIRAAALQLGWHGSAATLIQTANALAGATGVTIFAGVVRRTTGRADLALAGALLLSSSYAFWYYAVEVEVYTIAALFLIIALALIAALLRRPSPALAATLGLAQGIAVLFHQTNVLLSVPVAVALLVGGRLPTSSADSRGGAAGSPAPPRLWLLATYILPLGMVVVGSYLWVGLGVSGFRSWAELSAWMQGYARTGWWGGAVNGAKVAGLGLGLSRAVAPPGWEILPIGLLAALLVNLRGLRSAPRGLAWMLLAWLLTYGAFFLWWEPDNIEFWIASLPPFYLLLLLAVAYRRTTTDEPPTASSIGRWALVVRQSPAIALFILGLAMLGVNLGAIRQRGDASTDLQRATTDALAARSAPGDLLVLPDGLLELYLPYYAGRESVISLTQAMTAGGGDWAAACGTLRRRVELSLASGYAVIAVGDALRPSLALPGEPPSMLERFRLTPDQVAACYAPLSPLFVGASLGPGLPDYRRIAPAQELADGAGWDFRRGAWGWRAASVGATEVSADGWALTPEADPSLSSPPLDIDAARYAAVELRLAASTAARDAQIFFLDAGGRASEVRALRFTLQPGPAMHTYRLNLRGAPGWVGRVGGLRLDPVGTGDGGGVTVESIRLLP